VVDEVTLALPRGATVADALRASGLSARHAGLALDTLPVGVWGSFCDRGAPLHEGDRVELYRPLQVDPKEARRLRYRAQAKPAGIKRG
jgi:putative ubiquitin-RnfH superfamily antitoxin RatB of RatAB toxin-antitoxin module